MVRASFGAQDDAAVKSSPNLSPIWGDVHIQRLSSAVLRSGPLGPRGLFCVAFACYSSTYMASPQGFWHVHGSPSGGLVYETGTVFKAHRTPRGLKL